MDSFLAAFIPEPFTVLGKRLRPFSIGRAIYLQRFDCDPVLTLDQLIRAVIICSRPIEQIQPCFDDRWLKLKLRIWAWRLGRFDVAEKIALFHRYVATHRNGPSFVEQDFDGGEAPFLEHLIISLITKLHYTREQILEMPYAQALWDYGTYWENEGKAEIVGDRRRSMHDLANKMDAEIRASLQEGKPCQN